MTCWFASRVVRGMSYRDGQLILMLPKYNRTYECTTELAYKLAYSKNPAAFYNQNIKNKLKVIE